MADSGWGVRAKDRPLYRQAGSAVTHRSVTGEQYGRFLIDVFEEWVRHDVGDVFVQMFDTALAHWLGDGPGRAVRARQDLRLGAGPGAQRRPVLLRPLRRARLPAGQHRRRAHACSSSSARRAAGAFGNDKCDTLPQYCLDCDVRFACNGGCPKDRFATTPDGEPGLHYLCAGYKAFFGHVDAPMRYMADRLRGGRTRPRCATGTRPPTRQRGRNDPCTCGSGRKSKKCHGPQAD